MKIANIRVICIILFLLSIHLPAAQAQTPIVHLVLFKLKADVSKESPAYQTAFQLLKTLPQKIKGIQDWSFGENFSTRPIACDVGLYAVFDSKKALNDYLTHPAHIEAVNAWKEIATWNIADYEETPE